MATLIVGVTIATGKLKVLAYSAFIIFVSIIYFFWSTYLEYNSGTASAYHAPKPRRNLDEQQEGATPM